MAFCATNTVGPALVCTKPHVFAGCALAPSRVPHCRNDTTSRGATASFLKVAVSFGLSVWTDRLAARRATHRYVVCFR